MNSVTPPNTGLTPPAAPVPPPAQAAPSQGTWKNPTVVRVVDFTMPFGSMVGLMVTWAIAAIPAFIILAVVGTFVVAFLGAMFGIGSR